MNDVDYDKWVASLKAGDKVAVCVTEPLGERYEIRHVEKILKRGIRVSGYIPFVNGEIPHLKESVVRVFPITEEIQDIIDRRVLLSELSKLDVRQLTTVQLREIKKIVDV